MIYIACYFNIFSSPLRLKLAKEFSLRYPWVIILENLYYEQRQAVPNSVIFKIPTLGYIDYIMINNYLKDIQYKGDVCILDTDLILSQNFRPALEQQIKSYDFVHGFSNAYERINGVNYDVHAHSYYKNSDRGHTGYIYCYNKKMLEKINYTFPTEFLLGGYDYVLALILNNKSIGFIKDTDIYDKVLEFKKKIQGSTFTYLPLSCAHEYHGNKSKRLTPFKEYKNLTASKIYDYINNVYINEKDHLSN